MFKSRALRRINRHLSNCRKFRKHCVKLSQFARDNNFRILFLVGAKCATETRHGVNISRRVSACVAGSISGIASLQGAGRQIGVLVFELAVEGEPPFIFVVGQKGCQGEHLAQRETRAHRASLPDI